MRLRPAALLLALGLSLATPLQAARAHPRLVRATPSADSRVAAPRTLSLTFNESLDLALTRVTLLRGDRPIPLDSLRLATGDANTVVAGVSTTLAPGRYTVRWQVTGADGHPVRGTFEFEVQASGAPEAHAAHAPHPSPH